MFRYSFSFLDRKKLEERLYTVKEELFSYFVAETTTTRHGPDFL